MRAWTKGEKEPEELTGLWTGLGRLLVLVCIASPPPTTGEGGLSLCRGHERVWPLVYGNRPRWETDAQLSLNPDVSDLTALRSYDCWCAQDCQSNGRGLESIGPSQIRRGPEIQQALSVHRNAFSHPLPCHTHSSLACTPNPC